MRTTGSASSFNRSGSVATPATTKFGALAQCRSVQLEAIIIGLAAVALRLVSHPRIAAHLHNAVHVAARSHVTHAHMPALLLLFTLPLLGLIAGAVSIRQQIGDPSFRSRLGRTFAEGFTIESFDVRAMRRRPGSRHVFSFEIVAANPLTGKQSSIGLVCKRDTTSAAGKAIREFEAMRLLWDRGFGRDEQFKIPEPVQHFPDLSLILQGRARGSKLRTYLGRASEASLRHMRMTGLWLAKLHSLPMASAQVCAYADDATLLQVHVAALRADQPGLTGELLERAAVVEQAFARFQDVPAAMVHGDFHPDHIFVDKACITVIDFERFCVGDPARDLGSFIAHMRTMAGLSGRSPDAANREIYAFLTSYFRAIPRMQAPIIAGRIAPYATLASIEALYYVASVLKVTDPDRLAMYVNCVRESASCAAEFTSALEAGQAASA